MEILIMICKGLVYFVMGTVGIFGILALIGCYLEDHEACNADDSQNDKRL